MAEDKQDSEAEGTQAKDPPRDAAGKQGALERFKNSHLGQILITAVAVATLTAGVAHWFYESIRIPSMTSQIAFRDDKIKSVETELQTEREKTKALGVDLERERFQSSGLKGALDQSATKLILVRVQAETNNPGPCTDAPYPVLVRSQPWQARFQGSHHPDHV